MRELVLVFTNPKEVFERRPNLWIPFAILLVLALINTVITGPVTYEFALERTKEAMEKAGQSFEPFTYNRFITFSMLGVILVLPLKVLLQGLIYNIFMPLLGGTGFYQYGVIVAVFAAWISTVGNFLKSILMRITKVPIIHFDLGVFMIGKNTYLSRVLTHVDLFTIWGLIVAGVGLSVLYTVNRKKAMLFVFGVWIIYVLLFALIPGTKA